MTDAVATRLVGENSDVTHFAGESYRTRLATGATPNDKTRIAQEGDQSKLARDAANEQPDASEFYKVGDKIGDRYEVSAIHHGAMGVVYGCFDHKTKLPRALKTVRSRHLHNKQVLSLFESEAAVWISLEKHPYIVRAYLVERFNNLPYVIAEYVRGPEGMEGDLRGWLGHPRLTLSVAVAMALQIAQGMQHTVRKVPNLVHRDLKPANILVNGNGKAMVTDFGLVNAAETGAGTPAYMSPEQWRDDALDARSDIYSYGCILFEMITAYRLFPASTEHDWESAHLESAPTALTSIIPELPSEIDQFVRRCLEKEPMERPQNWDEVVAFFSEWYHRLTGKAVIFDFSSLALDAAEWLTASYSLANLKRYDEMLLACERSLAIEPNIAVGWSNKGVALQGLKRYDEALKANDMALTIDENFTNALINRSSNLLDLKRYDEMLLACERALAIDPNIAVGWSNKGVALQRLKRYDEALKANDRALEIDENNANTLSNRISTLLDLNRYDEALSTSERALAIDRNVIGVWNNKGIALQRLKRYEESIPAYDRALAIDENNVITLSNKGNVLKELNRYQESIQAYDRALAIDPNYANAWYNKGLVLSNLKLYDEAIQTYDRSLSIDQNFADAWCSKANAFYRLKRYDEAIQSYERALAINPNDFTAWYNKGTALYCLGRYEEAIHAFDRVLLFDQKFAGVCYNKGLALSYLKRYDEAIQVYDQALEIDQNHPGVVQSRKSAIDALKNEQHPQPFWARIWGK